MGKLVWFCMLMSCSLLAQADLKTNTGFFDKPEQLFGKQYKVLMRADGDLNQDQRPDAVLIVSDTQPQHRLKNTSLGADTLDLNPRFLVVLLKSKDGKFAYNPLYKLPVMPAGDTAATCLEDPLYEGNVKVEKGVLKLTVQYFMSCGGWTVSLREFIFRFQNEGFELIGLEQHDYSRSSGETSDYSYNFSTGRLHASKGWNQFDDTVTGTSKKYKLKKTAPITFERFQFDAQYPTQ